MAPSLFSFPIVSPADDFAASWSFRAIEDSATSDNTDSGALASRHDSDVMGTTAPTGGRQGVMAPAIEHAPCLTKKRATGLNQAAPQVFELGYEGLLMPNTKPGEAPLKDPTIILPENAQSLRIYIPLDFHIFTWLTTLLALRNSTFPSLTHIQVCFHSLLRPFLADLYIEHTPTSLHLKENGKDVVPDLSPSGDKRGLVEAVLKKFAASSISLSISFYRLKRKSDGDEPQNFRTLTLMKAIRGLDEHTEELSDMLAEESEVCESNLQTSTAFVRSSSLAMPEGDELL